MAASRTRPVLFAAFTGLAGLVLLAGFDAIRTLSRTRLTEASLRAEFIHRGELIDRIRTGALLPDRELARNALTEYERLRPLPNLRGEIQAYWQVLDLMEEMSNRRNAGVDAFFDAQIRQRRDRMVRISADLTGASKADLLEGESRLAAANMQFRRRMTITVSTALVLGAILVWFTVRRISALEHRDAELASQIEQAQEEERKAVARELHDQVCQSLSALLIEADDANSVRSRARQVLADVRRLALTLRPSMLDDFGLIPAIEWHAREVARQTGIDVRVTAPEPMPELDDPRRTAIYRIAREALGNSARHSGARRVEIAIRNGSGQLGVTVSDDGAGFDTASARGLGLLGMRERAHRLGGTFEIESAPGKGTRVSAKVPL